MATESLRRSQVIRNEARNTLRAFLLGCSTLIPTERRTHFRGSFPIGLAGDVPREFDRYTEGFMRILGATASGKVPDQGDLDILRDALNVPFKSLIYKPGRRGFPPYSQHGTATIRQTAEMLLQYLNLADVAGPAHVACQKCGLLMLRKRGGNKYCSENCRAQAWNYESRKEHLKRNDRYNRKLEGRRHGKATRTR